MGSEKIPLVGVSSKHGLQARATEALDKQDLESFSRVLDELERPQSLPLPEDHWINRQIPNKDKTFLVYAIEDVEDSEFCRKLVEAGADINLCDEESQEAPIHVAVLSNRPDKVRVLLENPSNRGDINLPIKRTGNTPVFIAAEKGLPDILDILLEDESLRPNLNALNGQGYNALYLAAKTKKNEGEEMKKNRETCVSILLSKGANADVKCRLTNVRQLITENFPGINISAISSQAGRFDKTPQDLMQLMFAHNMVLFKYHLKSIKPDVVTRDIVSVGLTLFQQACSEGFADFVEVLLQHGVDPNFSKLKSMRPVLLATNRGHPKVLKVLKEFTTSQTKLKPVRFDVWSDDEETVLHVALRKSQVGALKATSASKQEIEEIEQRYKKCMEVLLGDESDCDEDFQRQMKVIVNKKDTMGNTPLHYATYSGWSQDTIRKLLDLGANIGVQNWRQEIPLSRIDPQTLSDFLDEECLQVSGEIDTNENVEITFKYAFLAPPVSEEQLKSWDPEKQAELEKEALPETNCVWYMSQSPAHRHLVTHPVVTSFLWLKWQRIRRFFNLNLRFSTLFVACLTWYIFARFGGHEWNKRVVLDHDEKTGNVTTRTVEFCSDILFDELGQRSGFFYGLFVIHCMVQLYLIGRDWIIHAGCTKDRKCSYSSFCAGIIDLFMVLTMLVVCWGASGILWLAITCIIVLMSLREIFQMLSSFYRYFKSFENWIEVTLIILVMVVIHVPDKWIDDACNTKRCLAAVAILFSWAELITLVGRHPRLSLHNKYMTMFYRVLRSFFWFLIWYAFFLVAFGLGFYIMLHNDVSPKEENSEYVFFDSPWLALVKTSTMFIGELEFSNLPVDRETTFRAIFGYVFLIAFVFLIVIVLMNLLNGLAVSDTGAIEKEAEIYCRISSAETISYAESVLLGDPFNFLSAGSATVGRCRFSASLFSAIPALQNLAVKLTGATGILLFYTLLEDKQVVLPINPKTMEDNCCYGLCCPETVKLAEKIRMDGECRDILRQARKIILERKQRKIEDETSLETLVKKLIAEQKLLRQMIAKQGEEIAAVKKMSI